MNFFAHGVAFLDDPYYMAGTAVPDWLCVADRPVRVRQRLIDRFLEESAAEDPQDVRVRVALGSQQHLNDDDWFHQQRRFNELCLELGRMFRQALGPDDNFRAGFLGHIVTEMLLDRALIEREPELLEAYYAALDSIDPDLAEASVNCIATRPTERLAPLIPRFVEERFLFDYLDERKMLFRLNQVMRRVKLPLLPEEIADVLGESFELVSSCQQELLPGHVHELLSS